MTHSDDDKNQSSGVAGKLVGDILKKAVSMGAGAYVTAEDTLKSTLGTVQLPKELLKEVLENLMNSYSIHVNAEINFAPKKSKKASQEENKE